MTIRPSLLGGLAAAAVASTFASHDAAAQTGGRSFSREEIQAMVREAMPPILKSDLPGLVDNMLAVELGKPLAETFDPAKAANRVFGRLPRGVSPDCLRKQTPAGEPDTGECVVANGEESGNGAYTRLAYSKNLGNGNVKFLKRAAVRDIDPGKLSSVKLSDGEADKNAREFLVQFLGVPASELPVQPANAKLPVRDLVVGFDRKSGLAPIVLQKTVQLRRSFALPKPIEIAGTNLKVTHLPGPGAAMVALDDSGVIGAAVSSWQDVRRDPNLSARNAKNPAELMEEIADDIFEEGGGPIAELRFQLVLSSDWRGSHGFLLPAVQVFVAPVARNANEDQQQQMRLGTTAGMVREYALVRRAETDIKER